MSNRRVKLRYFSIVLLPVLIFGVHKLIQDHMIASELDIPLKILSDQNTWLEAVGRLKFLAASWFFAALAVLAVAVLARSLARPMEQQTRVAAIVTTLAVFLLALTPTIQQFITSTAPRIYYQVGKTVFETTLAKGSLPGCMNANDTWLLGTCGESPVFSMFNRVLDIVNALAGLSVGALIAGMILCLASSDSHDIEERAEELAANMHQMRQQLYLSSLILTFGMFFASSWMYWPMPLIEDSGKAAYGSLVKASALFTGTYFCLLLLSFYLPVALVLDSRVKRLALWARGRPRTEETFDIAGWKASHGLKEGTGEILRAGFALVAPILASFAGGITPLAV